MPRFQDELREFLRTEGAILKEIDETKDLSDDLTGKLDAQLEKFKKSFRVEEETGLVA